MISKKCYFNLKRNGDQYLIKNIFEYIPLLRKIKLSINNNILLNKFINFPFLLIKKLNSSKFILNFSEEFFNYFEIYYNEFLNNNEQLKIILYYYSKKTNDLKISYNFINNNHLKYNKIFKELFNILSNNKNNINFIFDSNKIENINKIDYFNKINFKSLEIDNNINKKSLINFFKKYNKNIKGLILDIYNIKRLVYISLINLLTNLNFLKIWVYKFNNANFNLLCNLKNVNLNNLEITIYSQLFQNEFDLLIDLYLNNKIKNIKFISLFNETRNYNLILNNLKCSKKIVLNPEKNFLVKLTNFEYEFKQKAILSIYNFFDVSFLDISNIFFDVLKISYKISSFNDLFQIFIKISKDFIGICKIKNLFFLSEYQINYYNNNNNNILINNFKLNINLSLNNFKS